MVGSVPKGLHLWQKTCFSEKIVSTIESNYEAVCQAMRYCQGAIQTLQEAKLLPEVDDTKIQELKNAIPDIGTFSESSAERTMGGLKTPTWEQLVPFERAIGLQKEQVA